jgi:hypothetical protein
MPYSYYQHSRGGRRKERQFAAEQQRHQQQGGVEVDTWHNTEHPCCRSLNQFASDVMFQKAEEESLKPDAAETMTALLQRHIVEKQLQKRIREHEESSSSTKKRRKKKKKKKAAAATAADQLSSTADGTEDATAVEEAHEETFPPTEHAPSPAKEEEPSQQRQDQLSSLVTIDDDALRQRALDECLVVLVEYTRVKGGTIDASSLPVFLESVLASSLSAVQLPVSVVDAAVKTIRCKACRAAVDRVLLLSPEDKARDEEEGQIMIPVPKPFPTILEEDSYDTESTTETKRELDYTLLMEEGEVGVFGRETKIHHEPEHTGLVFQRTKGCSSPKVTTSSTAWQLRRLTDEEEPVPWTVEDVEFLLQEYILLAGIHPDTLCHAIELENGVVAEIVDGVEHRGKIIMAEFHETANRLEGFVERFGGTRNHAEHGNIDMKTPTIMRETDEGCCAILANLLRVLLKVTRTLQFLLTYPVADDSGPAPRNATREEILAEFRWAISRCDEMWKIYLEGIQSILDAIDSYEIHLFTLADRHGSIPEMFVSATARSFYRQLVGTKIRIIHKVVDGIEKLVSRQVPVGLFVPGWSSSFVRRLFTEEGFRMHVTRIEKQQHPGKQPVDHAFEDILYAVREMTETVHQGNVNKFMDNHRKEHEKLVGFFRTAETNVKGLLENGGRLGAGKDPLLSDMYCEVSALLESGWESFGEESSQKAFRSGLAAGLARALKKWVVYRLDCQLSSEQGVSPAMPMALRRMLAFERPPLDGDEELAACIGGNGQTRGVCILVNLFFRRLSDEYKNWRAQLAEQELLTTIDSADVEAAGKKPGKKSKKKKKTRIDAEEDRSSGAGVAFNTVASEESSLSLGVVSETKATTGQNSETFATKRSEAPVAMTSHSEDRETDKEDEKTREMSPAPVVSPDAQRSVAEKIERRKKQKKDDQNVSKINDKQGESMDQAKEDRGRSRSKNGKATDAPQKQERSTATAEKTSSREQNKIQQELIGDTAEEDKKQHPGESESRRGSNKRRDAQPRKRKESPDAKVEDQSGAFSGPLTNIDAYVRIGVYDESGFQSAEKFWVGRLLAAIDSK